MRIGLDATYSVGAALSGVGVYSRELLQGLAAQHPEVEWDWFYRSQRFWRAGARPKSASRRFLADGWGNRGAQLFHGLNQRLPRRRFAKQIATFHDLFVLSGAYSTAEFRERFAAQARHAAASSDLIIAVSEFTANQVEAHLKIPRAGIRVVHHGVLPRSIPDLPREKVVLCVGVIQRRKNQAALVRAFRALPPDWTLVLAGSAAGFDAGTTLDAMRESGCADRIRITGHIPDEELAGWYARASIFAFPSLDEGFGIPILEAMAAGLPVVTSNRSALAEIAGPAALLVNPESVEELGEALRKMIVDEQLREELKEKGLA
ncbi:MAG: glycosyltransferase family 4 protein, partial [Acidobacteriota bacterium]|nr:glycosyltransferase family 4 protein [Acidobacteriota bacterium]